MTDYPERSVYPLVHDPQASIDTRSTRRGGISGGNGLDNLTGEPEAANDADVPEGLAFLYEIASKGGNLCDVLDAGLVDRIGQDAVREWQLDKGSRERWEQVTEKGLRLASQERGEGESKDYPFEGASDIHYPILTTAVTQFNARAMPELVKGDKVVGVKVFTPPPQKPGPKAVAAAMPAPQGPGAPQQAQQAGQQIQAGEQQADQEDLKAKAEQARGQRVAHYMNFLIFYRMDDWEGETDLLLMETPVSGAGFKKVHMGEHGLRSDYVSALRLVVNNTTKSMDRCPRATEDYDIYPYEIKEGQASGRWRNVVLTQDGDDPERQRLWIEQHRMEDLDGDGISEPYVVTVDVERREAMRIEPAFILSDVHLSEGGKSVRKIDRWLPFASFKFLPDPRGGFYGMGLASLLDEITDSVDTAINQMIDAGNAQIAGGGFIGANVRLQGSGQAGAIWFRPGEYQVVSTPGPNLQDSIWERTTPHPSNVTMQMLEMLLAAAKDIASVKDVITGDAPSTAPVGTTMALQNQALQVFSSIYKRIYRGFKDEFRLMFHCLRRWATVEMKAEYAKLTSGDFDQDFSGDGTDIQPIADPSVVTKMQKISRLQTLLQIADNPVGMAAGMQTAQAAQAIVGEFLDVLEIDRPERFVGDVPPNPELVAKVQEMAATAALKQADAQVRQAQIPKLTAEATHTDAKANLDRALTVKEMGEVGEQTHRIHQEAHRVATQGLQPLEPEPAEAAT